jgi:magnesium chelatase family protein
MQNGLPGFAIVGLPDTAVKESRDRVSAALKNCGFPLPPRRITINLSPADLKKIGPAFDLPIALGLLAVMGKIDFEKMEAFLVFGELSLQGAVAPVQGALALATAHYCPAIRSLLVPKANARELACLPETQVYGVPHLMAVVDHLLGAQTLTAPELSSIPNEKEPVGHLDYAEVRGQAQAKHAMEIAAAGGHNILMIGPPGSGKTMLAQRLPGILPPLSPAEALEATRIHSIGDPQFRRGRLLNLRPYRAPHHSASHTALVGGGSFPKPGEVSLAHHGVLFLDEMPEFPRRTLEVLRQPLEDGFVSIARAAACLRFPARFLLVGALNPCPCGFAFDPQHPCRCSPQQIQRYLMRLSGPLRDRFDLQVTLSLTFSLRG